MITVASFASSSGGNLYRVTDGAGSSLLLECGVPIKKLREALGHRLHEIHGVLISHEHMDHAKAAKDVLKAGVNVYCSKGTADALGISDHHRTRIIRALEQFNIGSWTILPFDVQHDAQEPLGYLIQEGGGEKLLFCADSYYIKYRFSGLNIIMVECDYSKKTLREDLPEAQKRRLLFSHMSLETLLGFLAANDLSRVREIRLIHLSDNNSDEQMFKEAIQGATGIPVIIEAK